MKSIRGRFRVGGHSKGGNLSIYAAANIDRKFKKRISCVYNNDGPGFREEIVASLEFRELAPKIRSFYPQLSIVGMLFSHAASYAVVESEQAGIRQHDPFSWHLTKDGFVSLPGFDAASEWFHDTFNAWFRELSDAERSRFVTTQRRIRSSKKIGGRIRQKSSVRLQSSTARRATISSKRCSCFFKSDTDIWRRHDFCRPMLRRKKIDKFPERIRIKFPA